MVRLTRKHGGVYRKPRSTRKLKQRPIGLERPRRESRFEYVRPIQKSNVPRFLNRIMNTRKSKKPRIQINLTKNLTIRKDSTYQYLKSILLILKQIVKDSERAENIDAVRYEVLVEMASEISNVLPSIKADLGLNTNSNSNNNNLNAEEMFEDVEEVIEIIRGLIHQYDRALRSGQMRKIETLEAMMELIAVTLDSAIQSAKTSYIAEMSANNSVDELAAMFNTMRPFRSL
jgi:hypothetical protein